jgi:hypothetical protein
MQLLSCSWQCTAAAAIVLLSPAVPVSSAAAAAVLLLVQDAFQLKGQPYGRHQLLRFGSGAPVIIAVGSGLTIPGYTLIVDSQGAADLYATIINKVRYHLLPRPVISPAL